MISRSSRRICNRVVIKRCSYCSCGKLGASALGFTTYSKLLSSDRNGSFGLILKNLRNRRKSINKQKGLSTSSISSLKEKWNNQNSGELVVDYSRIPKVPSTHFLNLSDLDIQGLYSGFRPVVPRINIFNTFSQNEYDEGEDEETLTCPWELSVSGLIRDDTTFKKIPQDLLGNLKPYDLSSSSIDSTSDNIQHNDSNGTVTSESLQRYLDQSINSTSNLDSSDTNNVFSHEIKISVDENENETFESTESSINAFSSTKKQKTNHKTPPYSSNSSTSASSFPFPFSFSSDSSDASRKLIIHHRNNGHYIMKLEPPFKSGTPLPIISTSEMLQSFLDYRKKVLSKPNSLLSEAFKNEIIKNKLQSIGAINNSPENPIDFSEPIRLNVIIKVDTSLDSISELHVSKIVNQVLDSMDLQIEDPSFTKKHLPKYYHFKNWLNHLDAILYRSVSAPKDYGRIHWLNKRNRFSHKMLYQSKNKQLQAAITNLNINLKKKKKRKLTILEIENSW